VLRWSSVVATALANGAVAIECAATPEEARELAARPGTTRALLGGERGNRRLPGFDFGNSPAEYTRERVEGRRIVSTTTNGTAALLAADGAAAVFVGAFLNLDSVAARLASLRRQGQGILLLAAGQGGAATPEDSACAGAFAEALGEEHGWTSATAESVRLWRALDRSPERAVRESPHAASLLASGHGGDLDAAIALSTLTVCPERVEGRRVTVGPL
jgi:2-phosphosulfolactate phosphatase